MALLKNTITRSDMLDRRGFAEASPLSMGGMVRNTRWNWFLGGHTPDKRSGVVDGTLPPGTWMMPRTAGGMASRNNINGAASVNFAGNLGLNAQAGLTGSGDITPAPFAQLVVSAVASLTGSGSITNAAGQAFLNAVASLSGSGDITATINALGLMGSGVTGAGDIDSASVIRATGTLAADITVTGSTLSTANVGAAVWQYLIESGLSGEEIMRLLVAHAAGDATNLEGSTPAFKSLDGTKTRIGGTYSAGTRTVTTRDGT